MSYTHVIEPASKGIKSPVDFSLGCKISNMLKQTK